MSEFLSDQVEYEGVAPGVMTGDRARLDKLNDWLAFRLGPFMPRMNVTPQYIGGMEVNADGQRSVRMHMHPEHFATIRSGMLTQIEEVVRAQGFDSMVVVEPA